MNKNFFQELVREAEHQGIQGLSAGGIIIKEDKVLFLRRPQAEFMGGIYELPSGKLEKGEPLDKALIREVLEETGIRVKRIVRYLGSFDYLVKSGLKVRQFNFLVNVEEPFDVKLTEHDDYKWVGKEELASYNISEKVKKVVSSALN